VTPPPDRQAVTAAEVADVRRRVREAAGRAGLPQQDAAEFTLAVNEVVINAIQHGGGAAEVTITVRDGAVVVEVRDRGAGIDAHAPAELPPAQQTHGRGLWLVRRLCRDVTFMPSEHGTLVRLSVCT
jgi:serine/threonine-protein kinase RsbW